MGLPEQIEAEIESLGGRYGRPRRIRALLGGRPFSPFTQHDRIGEVCMAIRRPSGGLLTAIKDFYPPGAFRLLTGGVEPGESIEGALLREVAEETGLDVAVRRFLAVVEYTFADAPGTPHFATFAFLLDELGGELRAADPGERIAAYRDVAPADLPALAALLEQLPDRADPHVEGFWRDWGRFRAIVHRAVAEALGDV